MEKSGAIWVSTYGRGINKYVQPNPSVKKYFLDTVVVTNSWCAIQAEDNDGKIWIGTEQGLISFDPEKEIFKEEPLNQTICGVLLNEEGTLWITSSPPEIFIIKKIKKLK